MKITQSAKNNIGGRGKILKHLMPKQSSANYNNGKMDNGRNAIDSEAFEEDALSEDHHEAEEVECKPTRTMRENISNVIRRIAAMGWKVQSESHQTPPLFIAPEGKVFPTIRKVFYYLMKQEGVTTSPPVQENFNSVNPASARYRDCRSLNPPPKDLQWESRKSCNARSEMRIKRPYVVMESGTSRQINNPVFDYYNLFHEKTGRRKDNVAQKVMDHMKDKALPFLINQGWKMREWKGKDIEQKPNEKKKNARKVKLYYSPKGHRFISFRTACKHWIEKQRSLCFGCSMKKARANMTSYVEEDGSHEEDSNEEDDSDYEY